jgi:hypothetical protein
MWGVGGAPDAAPSIAAFLPPSSVMGDRAASMLSSPAPAERSDVVPPPRGRDRALGTTSSKGRESRNDLPLITSLGWESLGIACDAPRGLVPSSTTATEDPILEVTLDPMMHPTMIPKETSPTFLADRDSEAIIRAAAEGGGFDGGGGAAHPAGRSRSDGGGGTPFSMPSMDALGIDWYPPRILDDNTQAYSLSDGNGNNSLSLIE